MAKNGLLARWDTYNLPTYRENTTQIAAMHSPYLTPLDLENSVTSDACGRAPPSKKLVIQHEECTEFAATGTSFVVYFSGIVEFASARTKLPCK